MVDTSILGKGPVALDASVFIYFIENIEKWLEPVLAIFEDAQAGRRSFVTSEITLLEVLVVPYRAGDIALAERYEALLTRSHGLSMVGVGRQHLRAAAQLRAMYRLRTPDALHVATAMASRCTSFVTNDLRLSEIRGLKIVQLRDLR